ncbi:Rv3654c family TadE-like protein [Actinomadura chokoriensis]|uniref:Rv3654c family TadE-like protein n=1 Tax=Actinomadura chokoriensis TaxID=454156 RepID=A0ABV4QTF9_9ACTN
MKWTGDVVSGRWRHVGRPGPFGADRGSGTIWVVAFAAVVWVAGVAAIAVGGVRGARHRGDAAADMAALAAAARVAEGREPACARARDIAAASGARLSRCRLSGEVVEVAVTVRLKAPMGIGRLRVVSRARAGPVREYGVIWRGTARCTECQ